MQFIIALVLSFSICTSILTMDTSSLAARAAYMRRMVPTHASPIAPWLVWDRDDYNEGGDPFLSQMQDNEMLLSEPMQVDSAVPPLQATTTSGDFPSTRPTLHSPILICGETLYIDSDEDEQQETPPTTESSPSSTESPITSTGQTTCITKSKPLTYGISGIFHKNQITPCDICHKGCRNLQGFANHHNKKHPDTDTWRLPIRTTCGSRFASETAARHHKSRRSCDCSVVPKGDLFGLEEPLPLLVREMDTDTTPDTPFPATTPAVSQNKSEGAISKFPLVIQEQQHHTSGIKKSRDDYSEGRDLLLSQMQDNEMLLSEPMQVDSAVPPLQVPTTRGDFPSTRPTLHSPILICGETLSIDSDDDEQQETPPTTGSSPSHLSLTDKPLTYGISGMRRKSQITTPCDICHIVYKNLQGFAQHHNKKHPDTDTWRLPIRTACGVRFASGTAAKRHSRSCDCSAVPKGDLFGLEEPPPLLAREMDTDTTPDTPFPATTPAVSQNKSEGAISKFPLAIQEQQHHTSGIKKSKEKHKHPRHSTDSPIVCTYCKEILIGLKGFARHHNNRHLGKYTSILPFVASCGYRFASRTTPYRHIKQCINSDCQLLDLTTPPSPE